MKIEVLGSGCKKCHDLEGQVRAVVQELGLAAEIEHVTDMKRIAQYRVLMTPALIIDGQVKCSGRTPSTEEIKTWLGEAGK
jgi:small redox-active disulfide protein 2